MSEKLQGSDGFDRHVVGKTPDGTRIAGNLSPEQYKTVAESVKRLDEKFGDIESVRKMMKAAGTTPEANLRFQYGNSAVVDNEVARLEDVDPLVSGSFHAGMQTLATAISGLEPYGLPAFEKIELNDPQIFVRNHVDANGQPYIGRCPFQGYAVRWKRVADEARQKKSSVARIKAKIVSKFK